MNALIHHHFKTALDALNYPSSKIHYSLGYTQGDGMRFIGPIEECDAIALADRLMRGKGKSAAKRAISKGCTLEITSNSHRYFHYNTMSVQHEDYYASDLTELESQSFEQLVENIEADIKSTSQSLERDGYAISEASSEVFALDDKERTFTTDRFTVTIKEVEPINEELHFLQDVMTEEDIPLIIEGKKRFFSLMVEISINATEGILYSSGSLPMLEFNEKDSKAYRAYKREMISEAIANARIELESMKMAA